MNPEIFAEWMRRQGHHVYRTDSSYWYDAGPRVLQAFPYHWLISPSQDEINSLMIHHGTLSLRYSTLLDIPNGKISYHIVLHNPYHLDMLKSQARNGVKRGLSHCRVEQISFERLATEGWALQQDTLDRQNRLRSMTQNQWERVCRSAADLPGFETWSAIVGNELAAAVIVCRIDDIFSVPYALCHRKSLGEHVNNALFYSVSCNLLAREGVERLFFTVQSLDAPPTVDDFKLRMGLIAEPVRQRVAFHPWLKPLATIPTQKLVTRLLQRDEGNPLLAKTEGMLRFHIEGKQPLDQQHWPDCLAPRKAEILNLTGVHTMNKVDECQIPSLPRIAEGRAAVTPQPLIRRVKRSLAVPWNYHVKRWLKRAYHARMERRASTEAQTTTKSSFPAITFQIGDQVRVRSEKEIRSMLDPFKELRGCAFLENMVQYCGTQQRVLKVMQRFLDERDYKVKKVRGVILLENVMCQGTPAFGACDRSCFLFWREEWLEKIA